MTISLLNASNIRHTAVWVAILGASCAVTTSCQSLRAENAAVKTWAPSVGPNVFDSRIESYTFPNGLRAILAQLPDDPTRDDRVFVGTYVKYGKSSQSGVEVAHMIEHLAANSRKIRRLDRLPDDFDMLDGNAMTRLDYSSLWWVVAPEHVSASIGHRANALAGVENDAAEFDKQIGRVNSEHERGMRRESERGLDSAKLLERSYYGDDALSYEDKISAVNQIDRNAAFAELGAFYRPDSAVLIIAGDFDLDEVARHLSNDLRNIPAREGPDTVRGAALNPYRNMLVETDSRSQVTKVSLGFDLPDRESDDALSFLVFNQFLMGGRQQTDGLRALKRDDAAPLSRVFKGPLAADRIGDNRWYPQDPPILSARSPHYIAQSFEAPGRGDPAYIEQTLKAELDRIISEEMSDDAIEVAKIELLNFLNTFMIAPNRLGLADHLAAFEFIDNDPTRLNRLDDEIMSLDPEDIRSLAQSYLDTRPVRIAIVLPDADADETLR